MKRKKTTKKKKLAERVAYNLRFSLIRLNYKAKMQLYEAKQAKRVVTEPINTPRTKKINGSFFLLLDYGNRKKYHPPLVTPPFLCYNKYINKRRGIMEQFLTDDDLLGLLEELDQDDAEIEELEFEMEMEASNRRYEEIIQKHRMD